MRAALASPPRASHRPHAVMRAPSRASAQDSSLRCARGWGGQKLADCPLRSVLYLFFSLLVNSATRERRGVMR